jgi:hypothetical protein
MQARLFLAYFCSVFPSTFVIVSATLQLSFNVIFLSSLPLLGTVFVPIFMSGCYNFVQKMMFPYELSSATLFLLKFCLVYNLQCLPCPPLTSGRLVCSGRFSVICLVSYVEYLQPDYCDITSYVAVTATVHIKQSERRPNSRNSSFLFYMTQQSNKIKQVVDSLFQNRHSKNFARFFFSCTTMLAVIRS